VPTSTNTETVVEDDATTPQCCGGKDPVGRLEKMQKMADELNSGESAQEEQSSEDDEFVDNLPLPADASDESGDVVGDLEPDQEVSGKELEEKRRLVKMGLNTALAIGLHNFPEGLATFVAALNDPTVGGVLAFAIAIHNIPEGLCVALPIYYATGSRMKGFLWALLSGASEIVAALLGWAILASAVDHTMYATLFGLVAGMMVIISIRELLPTAHHYDPEDTVVTYSFIGGMFFMALSLVLFLI
jgi:ZIP family zinc transporter